MGKEDVKKWHEEAEDIKFKTAICVHNVKCKLAATIHEQSYNDLHFKSMRIVLSASLHPRVNRFSLMESEDSSLHIVEI